MSAPVEFYVAVIGPQPEPNRLAGEAAAFAITIAGLLIACWFARRRGRNQRAPGALRFARAAAAAFFFAALFVLGRAAFGIASKGEAPTQEAAVLGTLTAGIALTLFIAFADLMLEPFEPGRGRFWLIAAGPGAALLIGAASYAAAWKLAADAAMAPLAMLRIVLIGAGAGLVWWSLLPPSGGPRLARLFE